ncbi:MAG TPA: cytochrome c oxidase assembly factor Coa1 family protein [Myxococcales bacterium]|jgi:hypothetical protein
MSAGKGRTGLVIALAVLGCVVLFGGLAATIVYTVMSVIRSSEPYQVAMKQVRADPKVAEQLGSPLEEGLFTTGQISTSNDSGSASLEIPVAGPRDSAVVEVRASRAAGVWTLNHLMVRVEGSGSSLPLLGDALPAEAPGR